MPGTQRNTLRLSQNCRKIPHLAPYLPANDGVHWPVGAGFKYRRGAARGIANAIHLFLPRVWHNDLLYKIHYPWGFRMLLRPLLLLSLASLVSACSYFSFFSTAVDDDAITIHKRLQEARDNAPATTDAPVAAMFPVQVNYSIKSKIVANHELAIDIEYLALKDIAVLRLGYLTSDGLALIKKSSPLKYQALKQHQLINQRIIVVPEEENQYYVSIILVAENGEDKSDRVVQIPIALGKYSLKQGPPHNESP